MKDPGQCVDGGARIGMGIKAPPPMGADAAPVADQQGAAEQVGLDRQPIVAPFVVLGTHAHQRGGFREERQLDRPGRKWFAALGHDVA